MTPEQKRLLRPLTPQTPVQQAVNLLAAISLSWPFSISRTWFLTYCKTFSSMLDPVCLRAACGKTVRRKLDNELANAQADALTLTTRH
jgi:hypothetical protein